MYSVGWKFSVSLKQLVVFLMVFLQMSGGKRGRARYCENVNCHSKQGNFMSCQRQRRIFNATVKTVKSDALCSYYNGSSIDYSGSAGAYGYNDDILWVNKGCRAKFLVCYTGGDPLASPMTTDISSPTKTTGPSESTSSPIQLLNFTFLFISSISTERSVTDHTPLTSSYVQKWHSSEPHKQEPGGLMTGLIVVSLLFILVGFSILVIGLIIKCQRRQRLRENKKRDNCTEMKRRAPYEEKAAECYYETISDEDAYAQLKSSEGNISDYFVLEPVSRYSKSADADASSDCNILETMQTANTHTQQLKTGDDDSHTYFVVEPQSKRPLEESVSPRDEINSKKSTALESSDLNSGVSNMSPEDTYSYIDEESIAIQSLPDNEYNVLHIKSKNMGHQRNYDTFQTVQHGVNVEENNEYFQTVIT